MKNKIEEIEKIINESNELVIIYVKLKTCHFDSEFELEIQKNIDKTQRGIKLYTLCYKKEDIPFPIPHNNKVYVFIPKNQVPVLFIDAKVFIHGFDSLIQNATSILRGIPPNPISSPGELEVINNPEKVKEMEEMLKEEDISKFPSTFQMARNVFKQAWDSTKGVLSGRNFLVDADTANARYSICEGCEFFKEKRCTQCGCFMEAKVHLELATCPLGKW
jgi:hypothetical protein